MTPSTPLCYGPQVTVWVAKHSDLKKGAEGSTPYPQLPPPPLYVRGLIINEHFQWSVNVEFASRRLAKMTFFAVKSHCFELMD